MAEVRALEACADRDIPYDHATVLEGLMHYLPRPELACDAPQDYNAPAWKMGLNIVIQVVGSRGDVQPLIAIGTELQRYGHFVRIATHDVFKDFVDRSGLEFYPIGGDPADLMSYMVRNPGLIPSIQTLREGEIQRKRAMMKTILEGCWRSCTTPSPASGRPFVANAIIANPPAFAHIHCAQALGIPLHLMFTMPWTPTNEFVHPLAHIKTPTPNLKYANYLSYGLIQSLAWQGLGDIINEWRHSIDLEPVPLSEGPFLAETLEIPTTYCWSPALVPKPKDWPSYVDVCGFVFRQAPQYTPSPDLQAFLAAGPPPIYIGFGSIVIDNPDDLTNKILEAIEICSVRAIISRGWSLLGNRENTNRVFYLGDCPHEWLFQNVSAVVHHGGAGTTACGLRCGKPTVVIPFFGDQLFWGEMVATTGAGPDPLPFKDLNTQVLAKAIGFALQPEAARAATSVAGVMQRDCGVNAAVDSFHRNLQAEKLQCDILSNLPAVWQCRKGEKLLKLSGVIAERLLETDRIKSKDLTLYQPKPFMIDNRRWDPASATVSSLLAVPYGLLGAANELWKGPDRVRRQARVYNEDSTMTAKQIGEMAGASLMSVPLMFEKIMKGFIIDLPLAVSEGLRATPRLYGERVDEHETITNIYAGIAVARKEIVEALISASAEKTFGRRLLGNATRVSSAYIGLMAYPAQGLYKSAYSATHSKVRKTLAKARTEQQQYDMQVCSDGIDLEQVMAAFDDLCR